MAERLPVSVRWLIRDDVSAVLAIEREGCARPWGAAELGQALRRDGAIGVVAESGGSVAGYMLYVPCGATFHIDRLAVDPAHRRRGVGRQLLGRLVARLAPGRRTRVSLVLAERQVAGQLFLRTCGFRAVAIARGADPISGEDLYVFHRDWKPTLRGPSLQAAGRTAD